MVTQFRKNNKKSFFKYLNSIKLVFQTIDKESSPKRPTLFLQTGNLTIDESRQKY